MWREWGVDEEYRVRNDEMTASQTCCGMKKKHPVLYWFIMAEVAKRSREIVKHKVGSRVSVGQTHFDYGDSVYSELLPQELL